MKALLTPEFERAECFQLRTISEAEIRRSCCLAEVPAGREIVRIDLLERLRSKAGLRSASVLTAQTVIPGGDWFGRVRSAEGARPASQLTSLTIGNSSNEGYLLAGNGRNSAGSHYLVGSPRFAAR